MIGRHPDVDHDEIGMERTHARQELGGVTGLAKHLESGAVEQGGQALPKQDIIVRHDQTYRAYGGILTATEVRSKHRHERG